MSKVKDKICVVTGAGSGIGRAVALELGTRGARGIAICDIDESGLGETAAALERAGTQVHSSAVNVADRDAVATYANGVANQFGVVHQLYNNAGVAGSVRLLDRDYRDLDRIISINLWGVIHGTIEFLPHLAASGDGHVINISSLNGYVAQASASPYCASKFAVRGFTESVRGEMLRERQPVKVTVVHPGGVKTDIANAAVRDSTRPVTAEDEARVRLYNDKLLRMDPARAARIIVGGVERNRPRVLVGNDAKAMDLLVRLVPSRYLEFLALADRLLVRAA
jgi:NAD(P)-dependent dehydrogenase (short-subunit alcohol dehydrogenase family)